MRLDELSDDVVRPVSAAVAHDGDIPRVVLTAVVFSQPLKGRSDPDFLVISRYDHRQMGLAQFEADDTPKAGRSIYSVLLEHEHIAQSPPRSDHHLSAIVQASGTATVQTDGIHDATRKHRFPEGA